MNTIDTAANTQVDTVTVATAMAKLKKPALWVTALTAVATVGYFGYKFYQKGKVVVDVVTEGDAAVEETPAA